MGISYQLINGLQRVRDIQKKRRVIQSIGELDDYFRHVEERFTQSEQEGLRALSQIRYQPRQLIKSNPYSKAYATRQMDLYLDLSGNRSYDCYQQERSIFDTENAPYLPYPYASRSQTIVGDQLIAQGFILKNLPLSPAASIVEFGPGWGNLSLQLALSGYQVTAVEIDGSFAKLIEQRATNQKTKISVVNTAMLDYSPPERTFDMVIFYESFHHCSHPFQMLENVRSMLKPGGFAIFAAEPIHLFSQPWGLRLDGLSLWSIRKHGWLELGFNRSFWQRCLEKHGFSWQRTKLRGHSIADLYICQKK